MTNYKLHEDCKQLSWAVYQDEKPKNINGWQYKKSIQNSNRFYTNAKSQNLPYRVISVLINYSFKVLVVFQTIKIGFLW